MQHEQQRPLVGKRVRARVFETPSRLVIALIYPRWLGRDLRAGSSLCIRNTVALALQQLLIIVSHRHRPPWEDSSLHSRPTWSDSTITCVRNLPGVIHWHTRLLSTGTKMTSPISTTSNFGRHLQQALLQAGNQISKATLTVETPSCLDFPHAQIADQTKTTKTGMS